MSTKYSDLVEDLYSTWIRSNYMNPLCLGNIDKLCTLEVSPCVPSLVKLLESECSKLKTKCKDNLSLACLMMSCCMCYDFNENTCRLFNNASIHGMWKALHKSIEMHRMVEVGTRMKLRSLMVNRTPSAFQNIHRPSTRNSMFKSNMTDPKLVIFHRFWCKMLFNLLILLTEKSSRTKNFPSSKESLWYWMQ